MSTPDAFRPSVAAVFVTFNRRELLRRALEAVSQQTRTVQEIVVVDNASTDGTVEMIHTAHPGTTLLTMGDNIGPAGGFAYAFAYLRTTRHQWVWAFNDDDWPVRNALETMLHVAESHPERVDALGSWLYMGEAVRPRGVRWKGREIAVSFSSLSSEAYATDLLDFTGTLWSADLVGELGVPRADFFMGDVGKRVFPPSTPQWLPPVDCTSTPCSLSRCRINWLFAPLAWLLPD